MELNIPIHAPVSASDGEAGRSRALIVDPKQRTLTHIVVREQGFAKSERLVPFHLVYESSGDAIWLRCTRDQIHGLDNFVDSRFADPTDAGVVSNGSLHKAEPYPFVISKRIPRGEVTLGRWALVEATDGPVGRLRSLVVRSDDGEITHLVVLTHHFLSRQEVAVPVGHVKNIFSDYILLRMNRRAMENLPHLTLDDPITLLDLDDEDLVPEEPGDAGVKAVRADASHQEAAHLLMDEVGPRLRARGFSDEQILQWAKAFLGAEHSGGADEFLNWIHGQEQRFKVR
jgi:sporulation protein YlmC with PRC-barrel domain